MKLIKKLIKKIIASKKYRDKIKGYSSFYKKNKDYTMIDEKTYINNLKIAEKTKNITGDIVECGVWRGGMIAGIAESMGPKSKYYLYDSFEGLPNPTEIDGAKAMDWQNNPDEEHYHDNCRAEIKFANEAMIKTGVDFELIKGWFENTIPFHKHENISLLRLDADWYESTIICLNHLFPKVVLGGIIIIDDYYSWEGCSKAVHDYLSEIKSNCRIFQLDNRTAYIIKK